MSAALRGRPDISFIRVVHRFAVSTQWEQQVQNGEAPGCDIHRFFCCCARRLGHMHMLLSKRDGSPLVIAGPCWPFCMCVTVPLITAISALVIYFFIISDNFSLVRIDERVKREKTDISLCSRGGSSLFMFQQ